MPKIWLMEPFGPKINFYDIFSKSVYWIFLKLHLMTKIKVRVKVRIKVMSERGEWVKVAMKSCHGIWSTFGP